MVHGVGAIYSCKDVAHQYASPSIISVYGCVNQMVVICFSVLEFPVILEANRACHNQRSLNVMFVICFFGGCLYVTRVNTQMHSYFCICLNANRGNDNNVVECIVMIDNHLQCIVRYTRFGSTLSGGSMIHGERNKKARKVQQRPDLSQNKMHTRKLGSR